jgi:hypothetical protein
MAPRDYESAPVSESLGLGDVVKGLAADLTELRQGKISPTDALARAALAKQIFNGVRLYLQASRFLEQPSQTPVIAPQYNQP